MIFFFLLQLEDSYYPNIDYKIPVTTNKAPNSPAPQYMGELLILIICKKKQFIIFYSFVIGLYIYTLLLYFNLHKLHYRMNHVNHLSPFDPQIPRSHEN